MINQHANLWNTACLGDPQALVEPLSKIHHIALKWDVVQPTPANIAAPEQLVDAVCFFRGNAG